MYYTKRPKIIQKQYDYMFAATSGTLLFCLNLSGGLPKYVSSGLYYTAMWSGLYIARCEIGDKITKVVKDLFEVQPSFPMLEMNSNSYSDSSKEKDIAASYIFDIAKNLFIASADYYYLRHNTTTSMGLLALGTTRFVFEVMQRMFDGYEYNNRMYQKDNNAKPILWHSAVRACTGTAVHLCIMTMMSDQKHLISKLAIMPYIYVLKLGLEKFADKVLNMSALTSEQRST